MSASLRYLWWLAALSVALTAMGAIWALFEAREVQGSLVWVKPLKFALSMVAYFITIALVVQRLSPRVQNGRALRGVTAVLGVSFIFEMGYITWQAAQGQASHFNDTSAFHEIMYGLMGLGAAALVVGVALIGVLALRDRDARMTAPLRLGVGAGFVLSCVLTLITAFTLGGMGGHFIGTPPEAAGVIPFFGWSGAVGDLRPSHFAALHAMQAIPLLAWAVQGRAGARAWIVGGSAVYSALTMGLYAQALMGLPVWRI